MPKIKFWISENLTIYIGGFKSFGKRFFGRTVAKIVYVPFFLIVKFASEIVDKATGSSVTKSTLSLETVAKRSRSLNSRAQ